MILKHALYFRIIFLKKDLFYATNKQTHKQKASKQFSKGKQVKSVLICKNSLVTLLFFFS